jgi:transcriptional regulator with XRE-family HTH domain
MARKKDDLKAYIEAKRKSDEGFDRAWQYRLLIRRLIRRRVELNLTQQAIASAIGVSRARIGEIETGHKVVGADRLLAYAAALGIELVPTVSDPPALKRASKRRARSSTLDDQAQSVAEQRARYGARQKKDR